MREKRKGRLGKVVLRLLCGAVLLPALTLFFWIFTERWPWPELFPRVLSMRAVKEIFTQKDRLFSLFYSSVLISTAVGLLSVGIGTMTARALVCHAFLGKRLVSFFTVLPFLVPATVFAMGVQGAFLRLGLNNTVAGVILSHLICSLPYGVRLLVDGMEAAGTRLEEQARVLGAGPFQAFFRVTLPNLTPVLASAMCMSYIVSFSQYFLTLLIGGGQVRTFPVVMVPYLQGGERNIASIYSVLFLGMTLGAFALFQGIAGKLYGQDNREFYS